MLLKAKMNIHEHQEKYISIFSLSTLLNNKKKEYPLFGLSIIFFA